VHPDCISFGTASRVAHKCDLFKFRKEQGSHLSVVGCRKSKYTSRFHSQICLVDVIGQICLRLIKQPFEICRKQTLIQFCIEFFEKKLVFLRWDVSVICPVIVLKLVVSIFTSLPFLTFQKTSVITQKINPEKKQWSSVRFNVCAVRFSSLLNRWFHGRYHNKASASMSFAICLQVSIELDAALHEVHLHAAAIEQDMIKYCQAPSSTLTDSGCETTVHKTQVNGNPLRRRLQSDADSSSRKENNNGVIPAQAGNPVSSGSAAPAPGNGSVFQDRTARSLRSRTRARTPSRHLMIGMPKYERLPAAGHVSSIIGRFEKSESPGNGSDPLCNSPNRTGATSSAQDSEKEGLVVKWQKLRREALLQRLPISTGILCIWHDSRLREIVSYRLLNLLNNGRQPDVSFFYWSDPSFSLSCIHSV